VPEELRGKGYGKVMMEAVLPEIEALGYKIEPVCPYVAHYINRNQAWSHLLA
ncbi:GNAT family N-acetyltransferase, partial [Vibrio sp. 1569]